jgi:CubicO group peptidase (beta-lactamase class C family)
MTAIIRSALTGLAAAIVLSLGSAASPASGSSTPREQLEPPDQAVEFVDSGHSDRLDTDAVDSYVDSYLDRHGLSSAEVAIVKDGEIVHTGAYGESHGEQTTTQTPMATGSVGKHVTSFALLQLVDAGKVSLDDPVVEHLPEFELADDRYTDITIRQLLSHTSGLPSPLIVEPASDLREGVERLKGWELQTKPGEQYSYSNMNYHVVARLIETVAEVPFATYLDDHLFEPLGMDDTRSVDTSRDDDPGLQHGHVTAYGTTWPLRETDQLLAGAGGIVTTAEDQAHWLAMLTNDGAAPDGQQLLSPELLDEAQSPQAGADGEGLGWHLSGEGVDPPRVGHSGSTSRYSAQVDTVPGSGYGVAVMLNSFTPTVEHNYALASGIIDVTEGKTPDPGVPVATLIDIGLALATLVVATLTVFGLRRAGLWSTRRAAWSGWRFGLRLLPQAIGPALAVGVLFVVPSLERNATTPVDMFGFWPAAMVLVGVLGVSGASLILTRAVHRARPPERRAAGIR